MEFYRSVTAEESSVVGGWLWVEEWVWVVVGGGVGAIGQTVGVEKLGGGSRTGASVRVEGALPKDHLITGGDDGGLCGGYPAHEYTRIECS